MRAELKKNEKEFSELKGKNVVLIFGNTGSGKSTLANAMISPNSIIEREGYLCVTNPIMYEDEWKHVRHIHSGKAHHDELNGNEVYGQKKYH